MSIRTVIVDDEPLARSRIIKLLGAHPDIQLVGQCKNGAEAITLINKKRPELIFLDIQIPDMDGFSVISKLDLKYEPFIIFATAYDRYALRAFDVHAIDYLLKPFDKDRFNESIDKAKNQIKFKKLSDFNRKLMHLLNDFQQDQSRYMEVFSIKEDGRTLSIPADEIYWIAATGNYVTLNLESSKHLYRETLNALELKLNPEHFLRIHRSYLVNVLYIKNIRYQNNNQYKITLQNKIELISSRSFKKKIMAYLNHRDRT